MKEGLIAFVAVTLAFVLWYFSQPKASRETGNWRGLLPRWEYLRGMAAGVFLGLIWSTKLGKSEWLIPVAIACFLMSVIRFGVGRQSGTPEPRVSSSSAE